MVTRPDANGKRRKTGGRRKGTPNKTGAAIREAMLAVFSELQAGAQADNGHFLEWARDHSTDFYKLATKLLPAQVTGEDGAPVVTRIRLVGVRPARRREK